MTRFIYLNHIFAKGTPSYGNRDKILIKQNTNIKQGDTANSFRIELSTNHFGTHIDLPNHFYKNGKKVFDYQPEDFIFSQVKIIEKLTFEAKLIDFTKNELNKINGYDFLIIKTGFEKYRNYDKYWNDNPRIHPDLAEKICKYCPTIRAIGFDFISLTSWKYRSERKKAHKEFLDETRGEIIILEDMRLGVVDKRMNIKEIIVIPWQIEEIDSAPVTVIAKTISKGKNENNN